MANFGGLTDHFGILGLAQTGGTTLGVVLELINSSSTPQAQSRADALDENGDIADAAWHGNTSAGLKDASSTFALKSGTLALDDLVLGELATGKVVTSISVNTVNGAWPQIEVSGVTGSIALEQAKTYDLPEITINGKKQAQLMGLTLTTGKLTDCSLEASCDWAQQEDGEGEPVAYGISGAIATASGTAVATSDAAPVLAAAGEWTLSQGAGVDEPQAAWHTGTLSVEQVLDVDIA